MAALENSNFSPSFIAEHGIIWYGISLWPLWASCLSCVPSQLLVHLQLLTGKATREAEKSSSTLRKHCSATTDSSISVLSTLFSSRNKNIALFKVLQENPTLSQPMSHGWPNVANSSLYTQGSGILGCRDAAGAPEGHCALTLHAQRRGPGPVQDSIGI